MLQSSVDNATRERLPGRDGRLQAVVAQVFEALRHGDLLVALDRDGTLVPIVEDPDRAFIDARTRLAVERLAANPRVVVAIVSARGLPKLRQDFSAAELILAGSYGLEIEFPGFGLWMEPSVAAAAGSLREARRRLDALRALEPAAILEDHGASLCFHWHLVAPQARTALCAAVESLAKEFPDLWFKTMPTSYEVLPPVKWDKGLALSAIEETVRGYRGPVRCLYVGDTDSDEPAFEWVNRRGGIGVRVGPTGATAAAFQVGSHTEVTRLLEDLYEALPAAG